MQEAGFARDDAGYFAASGERLRPDYWIWAGPIFERALAIMTDSWRRAGIDIQPSVFPAVQVRDNEARNNFVAIASAGGVLDGWLVDESDAGEVDRVLAAGIDCAAVPLMMTDVDATAAMAEAALLLAEGVRR